MKKIVTFILAMAWASAPAATPPHGAESAEDCPRLSKAMDALRWVRDSQEQRPRTVAECLGRRMKEVKSDLADAESWRPFLWESADFLRKQVLLAPAGSEARKTYVATELQARTTYREITAASLGVAAPGSRAKLANEYAKGVNAETNAFWLQAEMTERGLLELHHMLLELDPVYMLDQTAVRWLEAIRSCPNWAPITQKSLPDYKQAWCPADCAAEYGGATAKLNEWLTTKPAPQTLVSYTKNRGMEGDVKKYCGG